MRLFHVSEEENILFFEPRIPERHDMHDAVAGYYVSKSGQAPRNQFQMNNLFDELIQRNVEIRIVDNLWSIADDVKVSSLNWSLCRMAFAQPRK